MAFIEIGDQGFPLDDSQREAAIGIVRKAERPLLLVYIHGWENDAESGDACKSEICLLRRWIVQAQAQPG